MGRRRFVASSALAGSADELYRWHLRAGAFERLMPPWESVEVLERSGAVGDGARVVLRIGVGPFRSKWVAVHRGFVEGSSFQDAGERGPFAHWVHTHRMKNRPGGGALLEDEIDFDLGAPASWFATGFVRAKLTRQFRYRHEITAADLERHRRFADQPRLSVAVSGAGGLVGSAFGAFLSTGGHRVVPMVRREPAPGAEQIFWSPAAGRIDGQGLEGVDAVVHLAGENIAGGRWTEARKKRIVDSRVSGTRLIAETVSRLSRPPKVLVAASAIGFYGSRGDEELDEGSDPGQGFLPETCKRWEAALEPAERAGIRVVRLRIGVVLSARGGALARMVTPFRLGFGGRIGSGRQFMSWISIDDLIGVLHRAVMDETLSGVVNAVAPAPVRNEEFTRVLGQVLSRPTPFPVPATAIRLLLGELGQALLLDGARVLPGRLGRTGFGFRHPSLVDALRFELGRGGPRKGDPEWGFE